MRKKMFIIPVMIMALVAFGTVSSAHAFVGLTTLTVALAAGFLAVVTADQAVKHSKNELARNETKASENQQNAGDSSPKSHLVKQLAHENARQ